MITVAMMEAVIVFCSKTYAEAIQSRIEIFEPNIIFIRDGLDKEKVNRLKLCNKDIRIFYQILLKKQNRKSR